MINYKTEGKLELKPAFTKGDVCTVAVHWIEGSEKVCISQGDKTIHLDKKQLMDLGEFGQRIADDLNPGAKPKVTG